MSYSFWRPQPWRPGALAPLCPPSYASDAIQANHRNGHKRNNLKIDAYRSPSLHIPSHKQRSVTSIKPNHREVKKGNRQY